jgi:hypothetical protein
VAIIASTTDLARVSLAALALAGCVEHDADPLVRLPRHGRLQVGYEIGGSPTLESCDAIGAARFEVSVRVPASQSAPYASASVPCGDFRVTLDLPPGRYEADARLLDEHADPVTRAVELGTFVLSPGSETDLAVEFDEELML